jgi:hypothetical protein
MDSDSSATTSLQEKKICWQIGTGNSLLACGLVFETSQFASDYVPFALWTLSLPLLQNDHHVASWYSHLLRCGRGTPRFDEDC